MVRSLRAARRVTARLPFLCRPQRRRCRCSSISPHPLQIEYDMLPSGLGDKHRCTPRVVLRSVFKRTDACPTSCQPDAVFRNVARCHVEPGMSGIDRAIAVPIHARAGIGLILKNHNLAGKAFPRLLDAESEQRLSEVAIPHIHLLGSKCRHSVARSRRPCSVAGVWVCPSFNTETSMRPRTPPQCNGMRM